MTNRTRPLDFKLRKSARATFDAQCITSDAGLLLLRPLDDRHGLTKRLAAALPDRRSGPVVHSMLDFVRSRVLAIAQGYEDCNDFDKLRTEPLFMAANDRLEGDAPLPSQPTLSRFENSLSLEDLVAGRDVLLEHFIARHRREGTRPRSLTLDMDSTDDPTHGQQEFASFHTHYGGHILMQFLVHTSDGDLLFAAVSSPKLDLRASAVTFIGRIIKRLRTEWPGLKLRLRADNGFATPALYELCETEQVEYFVNCGTHQVLQAKAAELEAEAVRLHALGEPSATVRVFGEFTHEAKSWGVPRRIIAKAQRTPIGPDLRFLVTNSTMTPAEVYAEYCLRGQAENFIKDFKLGTKGDRLSCHRFVANSLRLLLHSVAYQLLHELRRLATGELRVARVETLRLVVLRVGALVHESARKLWVRMSSSFPGREAWERLALVLAP